MKVRRNYGITKWRSKPNPRLRYKPWFDQMREYWEKRKPTKTNYYAKINAYKEDPIIYQTKTTQRHVKHHGFENGLNSINNQPIRRLFDKPLIASPEAAMSSECLACDKRGMDCMMVRIQFLKSLCGKKSTYIYIYCYKLCYNYNNILSS